ncbi:MAG: CapA family protein [Ignavibacteriales bacterium]|nr:MAG: CapA family protein [Ignavibacteriales bacterium]
MSRYLIILSIAFFFAQQGEVKVNLSSANEVNRYQEDDSTRSVSLSFVGDLMCHSVQYNYARVNKDSFDFSPSYRYIKQYLSQSDVTIGNLETVTAGKKAGYSGYPFFNSPDEYISALKDAGFDYLVTANNHSLDKGEAGILKTIENINRNGLDYNGTFISEQDRDSSRIISRNGINLGYLSYTYGTNGVKIPKGKKYLINLIDTILIKEDIEKLKSENVDAVIVHFHFGEEYKREPNKFQKDIVAKTIEYGADFIIGGHPHVLQPVDFVKSNSSGIDTVFVAYSLGNFISNQRWRYSDAGAILNLELSKNENGNIRIEKINYLPTWVFKGNTGSKNEYIILPSESYNDTSLTFLKNSDRKLMEEAFFDSQEILTKYSHIDLKHINSKTNLMGKNNGY